MAQIRLRIEAFPVALLLSTKSPQILVKTSRSGRNPPPARLISGLDSMTVLCRAMGPPDLRSGFHNRLSQCAPLRARGVE